MPADLAIKIWKFEFPVNDVAWVRMPEGAKVLCVGTQQPNHICLWALVDPDTVVTERKFLVRGTGHELVAAGENYLGTVFDGPFVWHVFGDN